MLRSICMASVVTSLLGAVFAFLAGLVALKWLSSWLEEGRWYLFGIYCLVASAVVFYLHLWPMHLYRGRSRQQRAMGQSRCPCLDIRLNE